MFFQRLPAFASFTDAPTLHAAKGHLSALPPENWVRHLGFMRGRSASSLLLVLANATDPGPQRATGAAQDLSPFLSTLHDSAVSNDLADGRLRPRWGVECFMQALAKAADWKRPLDRLVELGLADPDRTAAALA